MGEYVLKISGEDAKRIAECMKHIADCMETDGDDFQLPDSGTEPKAVVAEGNLGNCINSMEIAEMFGWQHTKVFNMITKFVTTEASEAEKKEFLFASRAYRLARTHKICHLTEKGCSLYLDKVCSGECRKSRKFAEGAEKLRKEVENRHRGAGSSAELLIGGRSRTEFQRIKELFDRFITGPAIENREIAELTQKYQQFHEAMGSVQMDVKESNRLEGAVYEVAIEAEMQGFIYGFRLYEELLNCQLSMV